MKKVNIIMIISVTLFKSFILNLEISLE